ncbi:MAG: NAD(P)-dependent alcohol dehydrogenase, partial [Bacteroidetes bacterium]|nr:NAD(P)-dependent alcohol dehydrogenase [Bacteroidota bacterium]
NQKVLIYGASSSVGAYAIQLAKLKGAEVTAVCSAKNHALVTDLGADKTIDYHVEDFIQNGEFYDVIFDVVGKLELKHALQSLKEHGAYAHAVGTPDVAIKAALLKRKKRFKFIGGGSSKKSDDLSYLGQLLANGQIKTPIEKYYTMKDLPEAHAHVDSGRKAGNVIVQMMSLIL